MPQHSLRHYLAVWPLLALRCAKCLFATSFRMASMRSLELANTVLTVTRAWPRTRRAKHCYRCKAPPPLIQPLSDHRKILTLQSNTVRFIAGKGDGQLHPQLDSRPVVEPVRLRLRNLRITRPKNYTHRYILISIIL